MKRILALLGFMLGLTAGAAAQDAASVLLPRVNSLRASKGLPAYAPHASLNAAANNHARWMATTGAISHLQEDGSGPRARAVQAGFPSDWVSENIYRGASAMTAWEWWLRSPVHYAGLVSPNYDKIGIGSASGPRGNAYVLVFGNSTGRLPGASAGSVGGGGGQTAGGQPNYVLGLDDFGNIKHEVQPGQTIGHILLIYGYTWDEYPYLLEINGMSEADRLNMQPGSVILVPPKAGTYTPAPAQTEATPATPAATAQPSAGPSPIRATLKATPAPALGAQTPGPARATLRPLRVNAARPTSSETQPGADPAQMAARRRAPVLLLLGAAILLQAGLIGAAALALSRGWRQASSS